MKTIRLCTLLVVIFGLGQAVAIAQELPTQSPRVSPPTNTAATKAEIPASFKGGEAAWVQYLEKNLRYPKKALKRNIQGTVRVAFVVDTKGAVKEAKVLNEPGGGLGEEALRIIVEGPNWVPATVNGKKVIYRHIQAIVFRLE